ncbi:oxysterol-binding protein-like protein OBP [Acrasis kona]|uniref:Oxysterol-binding protein-like protein OBP n=1 Tax=Acrasis kona TaxID=1008807 RepID=A0AAW2ZL83_9EUKA
MAGKFKITMDCTKRYLITVLLTLTWIAFAALEFCTPFFIFPDLKQNEIITGNNPSSIYLYLSPMFICPMIGVIAFPVGFFSHLASSLIHFVCCSFNLAAMIFNIVFFKTLPGIDLSGKSYQVVLPPLIMGWVSFLSLILSFDQCRHMFVKFNRLKSDVEHTDYISLPRDTQASTYRKTSNF